jgi:hypothetical protein
MPTIRTYRQIGGHARESEALSFLFAVLPGWVRCGDRSVNLHTSAYCINLWRVVKTESYDIVEPQVE